MKSGVRTRVDLGEGKWRKNNRWARTARAWDKRKWTSPTSSPSTLIIYNLRPPLHLRWAVMSMWVGKRETGIICSLPNELVPWKPEQTTALDEQGRKNTNWRLETWGQVWEPYKKLNNICEQKRKAHTRTSQGLNWPLCAISHWVIFSASLSEGSQCASSPVASVFFLFLSQLISHMSCVTEMIADTLGFLSSSRAYLRRASVILIGK